MHVAGLTFLQYHGRSVTIKYARMAMVMSIVYHGRACLYLNMFYIYDIFVC